MTDAEKAEEEEENNVGMTFGKSYKDLEKENEELKEQLKNNPYVIQLQKEKSEMAEDFAKQIKNLEEDKGQIIFESDLKIKALEEENAELNSKLNHTHCVECAREFLNEINQLKLQLKVAGDKIDTLSSTNIALSNQIEKMKDCSNCIHLAECTENTDEGLPPFADCRNKDKWEFEE